MAEETKPEAKPSDAPKQEAANTTPTKPDLVTRVSEVKPKSEPTDNGGYDKESHDKAIDSLPPEIKAQVKAYESSVMSGANKKFMEAAEIRKELDQPWTPERVQRLLNDQTFVASAQEIAQKQALSQNPKGSGMDDAEWSALTDSERKQFYTMQQNQAHLQSQMNEMLARQEDQNLMTRYKNYEASKIDKLQSDLINGRVRATREHLHKVLDYDEAIQRAYEMGKQDRQIDIVSKKDASSPGIGVNTTQADSIPERPKGMSGGEYFKMLAMNRIKQMHEQSGRK